MEIAFSSKELRDSCCQYLKLKELVGDFTETLMSLFEDIKACSSFGELKTLLSVPYFFQNTMSPERLIINITDTVELAFVANNSYVSKEADWDYVTHLKLVEILDEGKQYAKFSA